MYKNHNHCRACGLGKNTVAQGAKIQNATNPLIPVFDLGIQPLANDFQDENGVCSGYAPLKVLYCPRCTLAQLSVVVDPNILYRNYSYVTSGSDTMHRHFERLWHDISMDAGVELKTVLEIGSNDGKFLNFAKSNGAAVVGIDPAENLTGETETFGIKTVTGFFDAETANQAIAVLGGKPNCIIARHVMCHIDDWKSFVNLLSEISAPETIIFIEVPYVMDLLNIGAFDTIYSEHLSYMSVTAMRHLLNGTPMGLMGIHQYRLHGGCIGFVLKRGSYSAEEHFEQPITLEKWASFTARAKASIERLRNVVLGCRDMGRVVAGFGASAKSTVWTNACGFTRKEIAFIADTTKWKWYKNSPGTNIPIVDEGAIARDRPDYAVMFAWNYRQEILTKQSRYLENGGHFIIPIPQVEIVSK